MELAPEPNTNEGKSKWWYARWTVHLVVLGSYPLWVGLLSAGRELPPGETLLPKNSGGLVTFIGENLFQFAVILGVAWLFSRASAEQMLLKWQGGIAPLWRGFLYSIALRLLVLVVALLVVLIIIVIRGSSVLDTFHSPAEVLVDRERLAADPLYFLLNLTVVSFVLGGVREEIWRAGVFAGLWALFPKLGQTLWGKSITVGLAAIIFGLGHLPQGALGVALTTLLGLALGAIIVFHRSIWDAALAHGFFDATTFLMLYVIGIMKWPLGPS